MPRLVSAHPTSFYRLLFPFSTYKFFARQLFRKLLSRTSTLSSPRLKVRISFLVVLPLFNLPVIFLLTFLFRIPAEKEQLVLEHHKALDAQETISAALKDQLVQAELRHDRELKEAQAAAEAKLDESLKEFTNSSEVLRTELEEETRARKEAQDRIATLTTDQAEYDRLVMQTCPSGSKSFFLSIFRL